MRKKYETHVEPRFPEIEAWARDGVSEENIARNLGVAYSTFKTYKDKHPALSAVLARTRSYVDDVIVTGALMKLITGYETNEPKDTFELKGSGSAARMVLTKREINTKHVMPSIKAIEFWLRNRCPDKWADVQNRSVDVNGKETGVIIIPAEENGDG